MQQQKMLSEEQSYSVICPCSKSISTEISWYCSLCHWVGFSSQSHFCFMAVSPSASMFSSIFFFSASSWFTSSLLHFVFLVAYCSSGEWEVSCRERFKLTHFFLKADGMSHSLAMLTALISQEPGEQV